LGSLTKLCRLIWCLLVGRASWAHDLTTLAFMRLICWHIDQGMHGSIGWNSRNEGVAIVVALDE